MTSFLRPLLGLSAGLLLGGCSLLPSSSPQQGYLLPASRTPAAAQQWPQSLSLARPQASLSLDSTRIAVLPQANQISSYAGARWSDPAPALLQERLLKAFQDDGRLAALSTEEQHLRSEFSLVGNLLAFQSEYRNGLPEVHLRLDLRLVRSKGAQVLDSRSFEIIQPVEGKALPEVIAAFGLAADRLSRDVLDWSFKGLASAAQ